MLGVVVSVNEPINGKRAYSSVPQGSVIPWNIPVSDTTGTVADYFDLSTGLGIAGTTVEGWKICDGDGGTVNMTDRYPRGFGEAGETLGGLLDAGTSIPSNSFTTGSKYVTVSGSVSMNNKEIAGGKYLFYHTSVWESDSGAGIGSGSTYYYPLLTSDSKSIQSVTLGHKHSVTFTGTSANVGSQGINTGGDDETRPNSITVLFITYVG